MGPNWNIYKGLVCGLLPCELLTSLADPAKAEFNDEEVITAKETRGHSSASTK